jgi:hypothetical protein
MSEAAGLFHALARIEFVVGHAADIAGRLPASAPPEALRIVRLFRDLLFTHDYAGAPDLSLPRVAGTLRRLAARSREELTLVETDGSVILLVSFETVAECLSVASSALRQAAGLPP